MHVPACMAGLLGSDSDSDDAPDVVRARHAPRAHHAPCARCLNLTTVAAAARRTQAGGEGQLLHEMRETLCCPICHQLCQARGANCRASHAAIARARSPRRLSSAIARPRRRRPLRRRRCCCRRARTR